MRKVALVLLFSLLFVTPVLAATEQATPEQAEAWNQSVLDYYEDKYGASDDYDQSYVDFSDWTIVNVDASDLEAQAKQEIADKEQELTELQQQADDLQAQFDYFQGLYDSIADQDYKAQVESILKETEKSLADVEKEVEAKENEIAGLQEQEYLEQVAVSQVEVHFGGNTVGTMTLREDQFVDPATGDMVDQAQAKQYDEVNEFLNQQPQLDTQTYHHESVGLFFLALGLAGWWVVSRKF